MTEPHVELKEVEREEEEQGCLDPTLTGRVAAVVAVPALHSGQE